MLPPTGIEPTLLRNLASKAAGLQVHATTPSGLHIFKTASERKIIFFYFWTVL